MPEIVEFRSEGEVRGAFRALDAIGPAKAQPGKYLGAGTRPFDRLLRSGVVREAAPGTFYLYEPAAQPFRVYKLAIFWIFIILLPILIIHFSGK